MIGCSVSLSTPLVQGDRALEQSSVSFEIQTSYVQVGKFADALKALVNGRVSEAVLEGMNG